MDFACVITGYGMLIVLSGGLWDVTLDMSGGDTHARALAHVSAHTLSCLVAGFFWTRRCACGPGIVFVVECDDLHKD